MSQKLSHLSVDVELHARDVVVVTDELVEDDVIGPVPLPDSNHVIKSTLMRIKMYFLKTVLKKRQNDSFIFSY